MWEIVKYMVDVPPFPKTEDPISFRYTKVCIKSLIKQGIKYLEDRYRTFMNNVIFENLPVANRGGVPGTYPLVKSFVGVRFQGEYVGLVDGEIEGRPLWPMVFYCLRCGDFSAAAYCLKKSTFDSVDLIGILEGKFNNPDHPDLVKYEQAIKFQYKRFIRNSTDPYKRIVYAVLGCCDINDEHTEVARTADDYLWVKLNLVRIGGEKDECIKYEDLQRMILEDYGESHYDALNQPHLYFQMLVLTGQFEAAFEFLSRIERYRIHGTHMAIALNELYIIGGPKDYSTPLSKFQYINFN